MAQSVRGPTAEHHGAGNAGHSCAYDANARRSSVWSHHRTGCWRHNGSDQRRRARGFTSVADHHGSGGRYDARARRGDHDSRSDTRGDDSRARAEEVSRRDADRRQSFARCILAGAFSRVASTSSLNTARSRDTIGV